MRSLPASAVMVLLTMTAMGMGSYSATAQPPPALFVHDLPTATMAPLAESSGGRQAVVNRARVGMRLDRLFESGGIASIILNLAEHTWTARVERVDLDASGFRSWVGIVEGVPHSHVVFTERAGVVSGLISTAGATYQIRTERAGVYQLERVDVTRLGGEPDAVSAAGEPRMLGPALNGDAASPAVIDVLMLYTPSARGRLGGTSQIQALTSQIISDTNTSFLRSGITARMRLIGALEFPHREAVQMLDDLFALRASSDAGLMRDAGGADLVQLLVDSPDFEACGAGYLLESLDDRDFPAYSVADVACVPQYTPTHEMGHNLGSNHAPEDQAVSSLFPYSFGYKDPLRGFRTVMAYGCGSVPCPRIPSFSNPAVYHNGGPTGSATQDNARSINQAAPSVASFREAWAPSRGQRPSAPRDLQSEVRGSKVTVRWTPGSAQSPSLSYIVQVGTSPGASDLLNTWVGRATSLSGVAAPGAHYWRVLPVGDGGPGDASPDAVFIAGGSCITPSAPRALVFSRLERTVALQWQPSATGTAAPTYVVEVGTTSGTADLARVAAGSVTSLTTIAPEGVYFVRIRAQNPCGVSLPSNEQVIAVP